MFAKKILSLLILFSVFGLAHTQNVQQDRSADPSPFTVRGVAEIGFLGVLAHKVQFSNGGTYFDYVEDGGQDVLFPVSRFSLELDFTPRNTFVFLYQPLRLESQVFLREDLVVDSLLYPAGSSVKLLYNFPFYRLSFLRELVPNNDRFDFAIGASLQIRNATISFESSDGSRFRANRDIGPVPALKIRSRIREGKRMFTETEIDGMYAPISYLNGSDNEVVGAILDASLRQGLEINEPVTAFFNLRYLGGGAVGTSDDDPGPGDGYVRNWLNFLTVTTGFVYEF